MTEKRKTKEPKFLMVWVSDGSWGKVTRSHREEMRKNEEGNEDNETPSFNEDLMTINFEKTIFPNYTLNFPIDIPFSPITSPSSFIPHSRLPLPSRAVDHGSLHSRRLASGTIAVICY